MVKEHERWAFFESGAIIMCVCGRGAWRRKVAAVAAENGAVWFRDCPQWRAAMSKSCK